MKNGFRTRMAGFLCAALSLFVAVSLSGRPQAAEPGTTRFVDLSTVPGVTVELAYGTKANCIGRAIYPADARAWADERVGDALHRASESLSAKGFRLVVLDAYRPPWAVKELWHASNDLGRSMGYLSNPNNGGSKHSRGAAVDVTIEHADGSSVNLPCSFDHFGPQAGQFYQGATADQKKNMSYLRGAMENAGFAALLREWWHYELPAACSNPAVNLSLETGLPQ